MPISILFIVPAPPGTSPGQRFRHEHYLSLLKRENIDFRIREFYSAKGWRTLYSKGHKFLKALYVLKGIFQRFITLFTLGRYTYVYVYREATPIGPAFFEWMATKIFRKKLIYDFDDAIWLPVTSEFNKGVERLRNFSKVGRICRYACKVSVGNRYLADFALQYNSATYIIPTVVNTDAEHNGLQDQHTNQPNIGWTGSFSTLSYLDILIPVLKRLQEKSNFKFIVIADKDPKLALKNYEFIRWSAANEKSDLLKFHIGLMPLYDDEISRGKCGFKAIQYMSLGIPAVVSPVGVNAEIVTDGKNGFVCNDPGEWDQKLKQLLTDQSLREKMGIAARETIVNKYSVNAAQQKFLDLFLTNK